jgi:triphosphoribosyl-dephospho-CoA synthase
MSGEPASQQNEPTARKANSRSPGRLAEIACLLEVTARKPGNVHRFADLPGLPFSDFLLSATAIVEPLDDAAASGIGRAVYEAIAATRLVVNTNTNLGMVLLLAPLAAVPMNVGLQDGINAVLSATTVDDARWVYRAIRLAEPGGLGDVPEQDVKNEPTVSLRDAMTLAADRDMIARQYADGFREVFDDALPPMLRALAEEWPLEAAIISGYIHVLARHPDSLILRKHGMEAAQSISRSAARLLEVGWPDPMHVQQPFDDFDRRLRHSHLNPGTSADLVTAALFAGLRDGTIDLDAFRNYSRFGEGTTP